MYVKALALRNFRNHESIKFNYEPGLNLILGKNGVGKTSLVEAIHYLSIGHSFRTYDDLELIQKGKDHAVIDAVIIRGELKDYLRVVLTNSGKKIFLNDKPIHKLSEMALIVNCVLFEPKDVMLFKGSPKDRRNYLDISIAKRDKNYLSYISRYEKVLKERNAILKADKIDKILLDTTTEMLVKLAGPIINFRQKYVQDINQVLNKIIRALTHERMCARVKYRPFVEYDENFEKRAIDAFNSVLESDIKRKATSIGVHREDFSTELNGEDISIYGSQGENRLVAIALKLTPYFLIEDKAKRPIIILDDVLSELDKDHRNRLIKFVSKLEQVFITSTDVKVENSKIYLLKKKGAY